LNQKESKSYLDAPTAAQFRAVRAHHRILHLVQTNEAFEDFLEVLLLLRARLRTFGILLEVVMLGLLVEAILAMPLVDSEGDVIKEGVVTLVYGVHG